MRWLVGTMVALAMIGTAQAEPVSRSVVTSGGWSTVEQRPAPGAAPNACMIVEAGSAVAIRSSAAAVDLMMANAHWDLPPAMRGVIRIALGGDRAALPVTFTTRDTAVARIDPSALPALFDAMSRHGYMRVGLFPGMPVLVPLAGFADALPAFRHCAGLS